MIPAPDPGWQEWVEMDLWTEVVWAARDAAAPAMNAKRRARFEGVKRALGESDLARRAIVPTTPMLWRKAR
jgi:hypothetical protein